MENQSENYKCIKMAKIEVQHQDGYAMQDNQLAAIMADATQAKDVLTTSIGD